MHQLSEKASDLAEENTVLRGKNTDKRRKINMLEDEQQRLVKRNAYIRAVSSLGSARNLAREQRVLRSSA